MAYNTSNVTGQGSGNALSNDPSNAFGNAAAVRELWRKGVEVYEQTTDFFSGMEGGKDAIIQTISDTSKGRGQKITFTSMAGLYDEPHHGDELFNDENGQKISKSKGNGLTIEQWLEYGPPESLAWFMFGSPGSAKRLHKEVIPRAVDDWMAGVEKLRAASLY